MERLTRETYLHSTETCEVRNVTHTLLLTLLRKSGFFIVCWHAYRMCLFFVLFFARASHMRHMSYLFYIMGNILSTPHTCHVEHVQPALPYVSLGPRDSHRPRARLPHIRSTSLGHVRPLVHSRSRNTRGDTAPWRMGMALPQGGNA